MDVTPRRGGGGTTLAEAEAEAQAAAVFRAFQRARVYEAGRPGVSAPPGPPLSTLAARAFSQLDPEASPGDLDDEDFPRGAIATISSARDSPQIPGPAGPPSAHASPRGTVPTLLEKVHRYVWPKEREECPQVAFEPKPCREIPITQWILRRVRRLPLFTKKKGNQPPRAPRTLLGLPFVSLGTNSPFFKSHFSSGGRQAYTYSEYSFLFFLF